MRTGNGNVSGGVPFLAHALKAKGNMDHREDSDTLITHALSAEGHDASEDGTGRGTPLVLAAPLRSMSDSPAAHRKLNGTDRATMVPQGNAVRRLSPLECERLQDFPDGWTCLCQPLAAYAADSDAAALRCTCPDSPRYRALGNAVTVRVIEWLGRRLL